MVQAAMAGDRKRQKPTNAAPLQKRYFFAFTA